MNLLFDLTASQPNGSGKRHGGGKYCEMLFSAMCAKRVPFKAFYDSSKYITPEILTTAKNADIIVFDVSKQSIQSIVSSEKITHLYSALPEQILPWPNCKIIGTIHGLRSYEINFDFFSFWQFDKGIFGLNSFLGIIRKRKDKKKLKQYYLKLLQTKNFSFVTVSKHSKETIQSILPHITVPVFYPPSTTTTKASSNWTNRYFLLVSANRIEKNCVRAIVALDKLYTNSKIPKDIKVKITGLVGPSFRYKIKNPNQFEFLGYVNESELSALYVNSWCFLYPSLNEGFGYPPLEAMQYGIPVIASNAASIPEVCENAVLYIKPKSIQDIANKILTIMNPQIYADFSQKSLNQFKKIHYFQQNDTDKLINWILSQD